MKRSGSAADVVLALASQVTPVPQMLVGAWCASRDIGMSISRHFVQHAVPYCARSVHDHIMRVDFIRSSFQSIMGAQQNLCAGT
jgi:hypothetical protein